MANSDDSKRPSTRVSQSPLVEEWTPEYQNVPIRPNRLRWRLAAPFAAAFVAVLLLLSLILGLDARERYLDRLSEDLFDQADVLADSVGTELVRGDSDDEIQTMVDRIAAENDVRYTVVAPDGRVIADTEFDASSMENHATRPEIAEARTTGTGEERRSSSTLDTDFLYVAISVPQVEGAVVRIAVPLADVNDAVQGVLVRTLIAGVAACLLVVGIAWFIAGKIVAPLEQLRQHAHSMATGDLSVRIDGTDVAEIAVVGYAFNRMTTELERSQTEIIEARSRLEAVLSELSDGVVITDAQGSVLKMNAAAETLLDTKEATSIGKPFMQVSRDHEIAALLKQALSGEKHSEAAVEHGLNRRTLLTTAQVVEDPVESLGLVVLRDITELRRLETVRREFVANVSHELRTPLTSIRAMVETMESGAIEDRTLSMDFLGRIVTEIDRLTELVEDLLDLARLEAGRTKMRYDAVDVRDMIRSTVSRLETQLERAHLHCELEIGGSFEPIQADRARVEQVLINLVHNAIKFTPANGTITMRAYQSPQFTTLEVQDTGIGIAPAEQVRLFERFYKSDRARRSEGTGLGLAIAKHIVQSHGGTISLQSSVGEGSTFRIMLPNQKPKASTLRR